MKNKGKTWSRGTNSHLPFGVNVNVNLSKVKVLTSACSSTLSNNALTRAGDAWLEGTLVAIPTVFTGLSLSQTIAEIWGLREVWDRRFPGLMEAIKQSRKKAVL